ncbi:hypothetical protein DFJ74DRAFT_671437 [Hyaloraphidium curvatum]|nr:hypothetical protein DFJ74DRAFT_671437 [Hyaloraphidium curvatum]
MLSPDGSKEAQNGHAEGTFSLPPRISFSPAEWLAAVPSAAPWPDELSHFAGSADPAAELRASSPLTPAAMLRELEGTGVARFLVQGQFAAAPLARWVALRSLFLHGMVPTYAVGPFVLGGNLFSERALVGGTVALVLAYPISTTAFLLYSSFYNDIRRPATAAGPASSELSRHSLAGVVRWLQLVRRGEATAELLDHSDSDPLCPCCMCAGSVATKAGSLHLAEILIRTLSVFFCHVLIGWTSVVTFANAYFSTWWGPLQLVTSAIACVLFIGVNNLLRYPGNVASLDLSRRIVRRAVMLSLRNLLARYQAVLHAPDGMDTSDLVSSGQEPYQQLHTAIAASWRTRYSIFVGVTPGFLVFTLSVLLFGAIPNIVGGMCIPLWIVIGFVILIVLFSLTDLVNLSISNDQIEDVVQLYSSARRQIRELVVTTRTTDPAKREAVQALVAHSELLDSYLEIRSIKAKVFGFEVSFGMVRNVVVSGATVLIALWTVLRAAGVTFTMQTVCPV